MSGVQGLSLHYFNIYFLIFICRYIAHVLEKACQFDESELSESELRLESAINVQSTRTTGVAADVAVVKAEVSELSVAVAEEMDGRINVE
jgi:hypothetical protein